MVTLVDGVGDECCVFGCVRILQVNFKSAIELHLNSPKVLDGRPLHPLCLEFDGKRKILVNGWALYTIGTHTLRYDTQDPQSQQPQPLCKRPTHSFRPFCYVLMRNETSLNISTALKSLQSTALFLWGEKYKVDFYAGGGDKATVRIRLQLAACLLPSIIAGRQDWQLPLAGGQGPDIYLVLHMAPFAYNKLAHKQAAMCHDRGLEKGGAAGPVV